MFLAEQGGRVWLASVPDHAPIGLNKAVPFLDLSDRVVNEGESGLLGLAFHPDFVANGRFFVSYICDKQKWPDCGGNCACYSDVGCDPSQLGSAAGPFPCRYSTVIAEYSAVDPSLRVPPSGVKTRFSARNDLSPGLPCMQACLTWPRALIDQKICFKLLEYEYLLTSPFIMYMYAMTGSAG